MARSGTTWSPFGPLTWLYVTSPSLVRPRFWNGGTPVSAAGSMESGVDVSMTNVPPRCWARGRTPTHSLPPAAVSAVGAPPTLVVPTTAFRFGSIRDTVPEYWFATHTKPPATASATGPLPTGIVATTEPRNGSIRETVESSPLATHTAPAPAARATGPCGTLTVATVRPECGSTSATALAR